MTFSSDPREKSKARGVLNKYPLATLFQRGELITSVVYLLRVTLVRKMAKRRDEYGADGLDLIETILVYKLPRLSREEIRIMLALNLN